jgi:hypothetical protein
MRGLCNWTVDFVGQIGGTRLGLIEGKLAILMGLNVFWRARVSPIRAAADPWLTSGVNHP